MPYISEEQLADAWDFDAIIDSLVISEGIPDGHRKDYRSRLKSVVPKFIAFSEGKLLMVRKPKPQKQAVE